MYSTTKLGSETVAKITKIEATPAANAAKKIRFAAYARVSTDSDEQLLSLETQKEHYYSFIKNHPGWEYPGLYYDEGISGTKMDKRNSLLKMLQDCEDGKIDKVITKSISRLSRNTTDTLEMVRKLSKLGVYIFFEKENIDTEQMSSELMLSILSSIAESESRSISENSKWSIKHRFEEGTYIIGCPPYGYENQDAKMVIVPDEAEVVKLIYHMALDEKIEKNTEQQQVLINLMSVGYIEPEIYHAEKNTLMVEADRLLKTKQILSSSINGDLTHLDEAQKLLRFAANPAEITEFDDELFLEFLDTITVQDRTTFTFNMKCGLKLTEKAVRE